VEPIPSRPWWATLPGACRTGAASLATAHGDRQLASTAERKQQSLELRLLEVAGFRPTAPNAAAYRPRQNNDRYHFSSQQIGLEMGVCCTLKSVRPHRKISGLFQSLPTASGLPARTQNRICGRRSASLTPASRPSRVHAGLPTCPTSPASSKSISIPFQSRDMRSAFHPEGACIQSGAILETNFLRLARLQLNVRQPQIDRDIHGAVRTA
jgi:hypothetical protein